MIGGELNVLVLVLHVLLFHMYGSNDYYPWLYDTIDGVISVWDVSAEENEPMFVLEGHRAAVTSLTWLVGEYMYSSSYDGTIMVWNMELQECTQVQAFCI